MALTLSSIEADFVKDTKMIGKQSAYLEFDFGGKIHSTDVLKSTGKFATWDTPVQLTGAGINMKVIAKASKTLAHDKALGVGQLNLLHAAGQGPQTVLLKDELTGASAGEVRLTVSGGSPAISGLPHTEGHGLAGAAASAMPGHHGTEQQGHGGALAGAGAGAGAAGLGAAAVHHHNQDQRGTNINEQSTTSPLGGAGQQGYGQTSGVGQTGRPHETMGQRVEDAVLPGRPGESQAARQQQGYGQGPPPSGAQHETMGQRVKEALPGHHNTQGSGYSQTGQTGALHPTTGAQSGTGAGFSNFSNAGVGSGSGIGSSTGAGQGLGAGGIGGHAPHGGAACPQCQGTGSLAQKVEQGLHLGGSQQQGRPAGAF